MVRMLRHLVIPFAVFGAGLASADEAATTDPQTVIQNQIQAFRAGDDARAYSYAAPSIANYFPTVDSFMAMVKKGYSPVWQPLDFAFGRTKEIAPGAVAQEVLVTAKDGTSWKAIYSLIKLQDGSWKINGVQLLKDDGAST